MYVSEWTCLIIFRATCFVDKDYETVLGRRGNVKSPNYDRLWRVADPINLFLQMCQKSWNPGLHLSIDEMMVGTIQFLLTCDSGALLTIVSHHIWYLYHIWYPLIRNM